MVLHRTGIYAIIVTLLSALILTSCSHGPPVPFQAFDFTVEDLFTEEDLHLADFQGRPVLIYFFASW